MLEAYLVSVTKDNVIETSTLIYPKSPESKLSEEAEKEFLAKCKGIDPKFETLDGDDIEDILSDGYYESGERTVCICTFDKLIGVDKK